MKKSKGGEGGFSTVGKNRRVSRSMVLAISPKSGQWWRAAVDRVTAMVNGGKGFVVNVLMATDHYCCRTPTNRTENTPCARKKNKSVSRAESSKFCVMLMESGVLVLEIHR